MENKAKYCDNCKKYIEHNVDIHILRCKKLVKLCEMCGEGVKSDEMTEHLKSMHVIERCDFCTKPFERWKMEEHKNDCPRRPLLCKFCNLNVAFDDFKSHAEVCWSRTEKCSNCAQYVMLKDMEFHEKFCKNPSMTGIADCRFCKGQFSFHIIKTHESSCGERTIRCPDCGDLIKKYTDNHSCKAKKDSDSMTIVRCISCNKKYPQTLLHTHIKECHVNTNNRNSSTSTFGAQPEKDNWHGRSQEVSRPFNGNQHFPIEPVKDQAIELSPPVQRDLSDPRLNRTYKDGKMSQCQLCQKYLIPQESRIHPEVCSMRPVQCTLCQNRVPFNILRPELHNCQYFKPPDYNTSGSSALERLPKAVSMSSENKKNESIEHKISKIHDIFPNLTESYIASILLVYDNDESQALEVLTRNEPYRQEKYSSEYSSSSNLSKEASRVQTQDCPLCFKTYPMDRFNDHVRACAKGKCHCNFCKKDFYGDLKEHMEQCPGKQSKKGKKKNEEKNEGLLSRGLNLFNFGQKRGRKDYGSPVPPEVVDGIPCEFCNEIYPFAEIAVHELGCLHEMAQAEERIKRKHNEKKPKEEVPQASGFTPFDPRQYMITDPFESKDREPRKERFAEKSSKDVSSKFSSSELHQRSRNSNTRHSDAYYNDFYDRHLVKDHTRDTSAGRSQKEPTKSIEEEKKKDVIFTYSSETNNKFPVEEKRLEQGVRPKFPAGKYASKKYSSQKGLNCISDSDEDADLYHNKVKDVNMEDLSTTVYAGDRKLNAIGSEREPKKSSIESKNIKSCTFNENGTALRSSSQDVSSCVTEKKGSFNSDTSEDVYLSCDEGEEVTEEKSFNKDVKVLMKEERGDIQLENCSGDRRSVYNQEDTLQKHCISMSDFEKYSKHGTDANVLRSEEKDNRDCNAGKISLVGLEERLQKHGISMNVFQKKDQNDNHHLKAFDAVTSKSSITHEEKYVMDIDDLENVADKKNEETFASGSKFGMNPFEAMSNRQFSYETVSSLPPYTTSDSDCTSSGAVDMKSDDNLDAYLQFLGVEDSEPDANYKLFGTTHGSMALKPVSSNGCLENGQLAANNANINVSELSSDPQDPLVLTEDLKGVSKNMPSYTSPFLIGSENEEGGSGISTQRKYPVQLHEKEIREISDKTTIEVKRLSQEEKDNEFNSKIWGTWREPHQSDSDE